MAIDIEAYYQSYRNMILNRCRVLVKDEQKAFDIMHDTFVQLAIHQARLEDRAPAIVTEEPGGAKVINIMDALKKSVQQGRGTAAKSRTKKTASSRVSAKKTTRGHKRKSA